jgi:hypothetical protein
MAVTRQATVQEIGTVFAKRAIREPIVRELWITEGNHGVHLWLLVDQIDDEAAELALYGLTDVVYERFPEVDVQMHVMNPRDDIGDPRQSLLKSARQILLRSP